MLLLQTRGKAPYDPDGRWLDYLAPAQEERVLASLGLTVDQARPGSSRPGGVRVQIGGVRERGAGTATGSHTREPETRSGPGD